MSSSDQLAAFLNEASDPDLLQTSNQKKPGLHRRVWLLLQVSARAAERRRKEVLAGSETRALLSTDIPLAIALSATASISIFSGLLRSAAYAFAFSVPRRTTRTRPVLRRVACASRH
jgi:hypothetical protein